MQTRDKGYIGKLIENQGFKKELDVYLQAKTAKTLEIGQDQSVNQLHVF